MNAAGDLDDCGQSVEVSKSFCISAKMVTAAYLLQQIQLLSLDPLVGNRSAEAAFRFDYEVRCAQWASDTLRLSESGERLIIALQQ